MSAPRSLHLDTEYRDSQLHSSDYNSIDQENIKEALTQIRHQGLQNLVAIPPEGGAPAGKTFDLPDEIDGAADWAARRNEDGMNLYFTVNPVNKRISKKPTKDDIACAEYAHVDIDPDVSTGYEEGRRRLLEETLPALKAFDPAPALIIDSGNGLGVFWRTDAAQIQDVEVLNQRLIAKFGGDSGTWNVDRLMRLPGTLNYPSKNKLGKGYPAEPGVARLLVSNPGGYSVEALGAALPATGVAAQVAQKALPRAPLTSEEEREAERRLDAALHHNDLLRHRWDGSSAGLNDTSRSGMDFSVTALLKSEGFTRDEVGYLLVKCFKHGKGAENDERSIQRCWDNTTVSAGDGVRGWVNTVFTPDEAARVAGLDPDRFAGLTAYSILLRGAGTKEDVVRQAHTRALETINDTFAKTMIGGKVAIIREFTDPSFEVPTYAAMAPGQFTEWWRGHQAYRVGRDGAVPTNLGKDWLDWPGKRQYSAMTFKPGQVPDDVYNAWKGFPIEPKQGDWSLMQQLIEDGLCDGNEEHSHVVAGLDGKRPPEPLRVRGRGDGLSRGEGGWQRTVRQVVWTALREPLPAPVQRKTLGRQLQRPP